jgi:hypothetical protein
LDTYSQEWHHRWAASSGQKNEQKASPKIMNFKAAAATLGAAILIAGVPVLASAAPTQPSPIRLDSVQVAPTYGTFQDFFPGLVTVSFTNQASVPVTNVVFDVESNGRIIHRIKDVGSYAYDQTIKHSFSYPDTQVNENPQLAVESVTFADGTTWTNTDQMGSRRQSAQNAPAPSAAALFPYQTTTN